MKSVPGLFILFDTIKNNIWLGTVFVLFGWFWGKKTFLKRFINLIVRNAF